MRTIVTDIDVKNVREKFFRNVKNVLKHGKSNLKF